MENASKALIIAGAILLSIAIIAVGMFVFTSVSDMIKGASDMTPEQIAAYNDEFENYGNVQRETQVKALCDKVRNHNQAAKDPSELIAIVEKEATDPTPAASEEDAKGTTTSEINTIKNKILSGKTYTVTFGYDKDSSLITQIGIVEVK